MNNMETVISELQHKSVTNERWIDTIGGWNNFNFESACKDINLKYAISKAIIISGKKEFRKATDITFIKGKPYRKEEFIERLLTLANINLYNQFNIASNKESIDLIQSDSIMVEAATSLNIIELKEWNSNDTPIYGIIELLKNYLILETDIVFRTKIKQLSFIAPKAYFEKYKGYEGYFSLLDKIRTEFPEIDLNIFYLDVSEQSLYDIIKTTEENEIIKLSDYENEIQGISKLNMENWVKISDISQVPKR